jgi:hypothetical protein
LNNTLAAVGTAGGVGALLIVTVRVDEVIQVLSVIALT